MEADLARYYHCSIVDYWEGGLSQWQLLARVRHLPVESACNAALGGDELTVAEYLLFDWINMNSKDPHPSDPRVKKVEKAKRAALVQARERAMERRQRLGMQGSVLRKPTD